MIFLGIHAWEQRKLGEMVSFSKGNGYSKGSLIEEGTPVVLYGRLYTDYETCISHVDTFVSPQPNSIFSRGGEVLVPASGESAEDIARASVIESAGVILGGDLNILSVGSMLKPVFLAISLSHGRQKLNLAKRAQGKSVVHIRNSDIAALFFSYPTLPEQQKIGSFFRQLDSLITLHQYKYFAHFSRPKYWHFCLKRKEGTSPPSYPT